MTAGSRSLRIAVFTETFLPKVDGIVSVLCLMLRRLQEQGHRVILFGPPGGPPEYAGAEVIGVGGPQLPFYPELRINFPRTRIWRKVQQFQPDLIHVVNPFFLGPFGLFYARRLKVPTLASFHTDLARYAEHYGMGFASPMLWLYMRTLHNQAEVNLCPSTAVRKDLLTHGFRRVRWWKRGIDTDLFTPGPRDEAMRSHLTAGHPEDFLVINVGRQSPEKNLLGLREALFPRQGVRLALVGGGPSHEQLTEHFRVYADGISGLSSRPGLGGRLSLGGCVCLSFDHGDLWLGGAGGDGVPAARDSARSGGVLDTVVDGVNGLMFDPAQPQQIGQMVDRLRAHPEQRDLLAERGLHHARSRSWRATMDQLVDYYRLAIRVFQHERLRRLLPQPRKRLSTTLGL